MPFSLDIATDHYVTSSETRDEIRNWILGSCIDNQFDRTLPRPTSVKGEIYEGLYEFDAPQCSITGYPIAEDDILQQGQQVASRKDYNLYTTKAGQSPWM